ncbi:AAC(3) family N-acetyltransferase [Shimazuella sp. AN120528]|uniref:aminoglycoside N(3)-acetyltransferase n=1 Tax=Shimazuella soli TaxID=1892854 RepID=UPI001F0D2B71|nr:AAC(3) family N-acetyltransferase [Shimazuella soli]MCH5583678.1 AAC(3) family N-acetyltransferase [Shimazuella soli]
MSEKDVIEMTTTPHTIDSLAHDFRKLGLQRGMNIIVHSSLSSIGYVSGGAVAVVQALMQVITEQGTIVMPTHSGDLSDPKDWSNPPVPKDWRPLIRDTMPAFHPAYTSTRGMGQIVEVFRTFPEVLRSYHPSVSFAAWGKHASFIIQDHPLDNPMGEGSPLAKLYDLDGSILLIGVDHDSNSSLHLAEYRQTQQNKTTESASILWDGQRQWVTFESIDYQTELFPQVGAEFEVKHGVIQGKVGKAEVRLISQKKMVDFAAEWLNKR